MSDLFGFTRTVVKPRYALITPDGFVPSVLPGWKNVVVIINISPVMGGPRFAQLQITLDANGGGAGNTGALEHFYYVLAGKCSARLGRKIFELTAGSYAFIPPKTDFQFGDADKGTRLLVFQKQFQPLAGAKKSGVIVGHEREMKAPNSKLQHPEKLQASSSKKFARGRFEVWSLKFLWSLEVGAWSFSA